tara:strand:- start:621 stop:1454 length:834 start_codon:yes stop_codon:yes gene_type:complete
MGFIGDLIRGKRGKKQAAEDTARFTEQQNIALGKEADFYKDEQAGKFDARVSQAQRDLATSGMKGYDDSAIKARQMSELAALSNDPRALLGGIAGTTKRAQDATTQQAQAEMNQALKSEQGLANLEDQALAKNVGFDKMLASRQLAAAESDIDTSEENIEGAFQRKRAAGDLQFEAALGAGESALDIGQGLLTGGFAEKGMKVTPGEFSHKRNPIDIVREGAKIGEMTGGEYILNPEQAESIDEIQESISKKKKPSSKDLNKLYRAVRSVFSQRQFD